MRRIFDEIFGTVCGLGHIPIIPATWTSLAIAAAFWAVQLDSIPTQLIILAVFIVTGIPACGGLERRYGEDPKQATMDEAAGQTIALLGAPLDMVTVLIAFVLFRIFDVIKPWPARRFEDLHGGLGIMADDLMAGVYARLVLQIWIVYGSGMLG